MWGGGEINEMCESNHTMPSEMGGGGRAKRWPLLFKKDLNPVRLKFERKNFSNDTLQIFAQPFKLEDFCENFLEEKSNFYRRSGFKIELLPKTQLGHSLQCMPEIKIIN
jgi:hypothetical protein